MSRWAILISGQGSNLQGALDSWDDTNVQLVISNKDNAQGLLRAKRSGIPAYVSKNLDWTQIQNKLKEHRIQQIFLLGFMKILPENFVDLWKGRIFNLHPSLLPDFPGLHSIQKSFQAGGRMGVSSHEVTPEMDAGSLIFQKLSVFCSRDRSENDCILQVRFDEQNLVRKTINLKNLSRDIQWPA